jgi:hypothetical protein
LPALGEKDLNDLDFVAREADIVGYSFVQSAADMDVLADELEARGAGTSGPNCQDRDATRCGQSAGDHRPRRQSRRPSA